jgi:hypothetical protein
MDTIFGIIVILLVFAAMIILIPNNFNDYLKDRK